MLASWPRRRVLKLWVAGVLVEALLFVVLSILFVRPDPPIVELLQGPRANRAMVTITRDTFTSASPWVPPTEFGPRPDSFFTVLHWPLNKPVLEGGGRVVSMPMTMWWVPALYVGAVPLALIVLTIAWLAARWRLPAQPLH
jgi:hypothetical protein